MEATTSSIRATVEELRLRGVSGADVERLALEAWNDVHKVQTVHIVSAHELSETEQKEFTAKLAGSEVRFSVDPKLVAGVRLEWPDRTLDYSVRGMVEKLREQLSS